jgi:integrase
VATITNHEKKKGRSWRLRFYVDRRRQSIWLGDMSKRSAEEVRRNVEYLVLAHDTQTPVSPEVSAWEKSITGPLKDLLVRLGVCRSAGHLVNKPEGKLLGNYLRNYQASRTDIGTSSQANYRSTARLLIEFFGDKYPIMDIRPADATRFRRWLIARPVRWDADGNVTQTMASSTISKYIKRTKTMFAEAVREGIIAESPFADQKGGVEANPDRFHFVSPADTERVLAACPDISWQVVFSLARYAGMRCPSEVTSLKWEDVDFDAGRMRIRSPKTGLRDCPIFKELFPILMEARAQADDTEVYCVGRYGGKNRNLATTLQKIIKKAGVTPWPKTFVNLRSTRRTELQELYPSHVIDRWLGHTTKTAQRHYLQVTDEHWLAASQVLEKSSPKTSPAPARQDSPTGDKSPVEEGLNPENTGNLVFTNCSMATELPPLGLLSTGEKAVNYGVVRELTEKVAPKVAPQGSDCVRQIVELYRSLPSKDQTTCLRTIESLRRWNGTRQ